MQPKNGLFPVAAPALAPAPAAAALSTVTPGRGSGCGMTEKFHAGAGRRVTLVQKL